jgi:hypothetical protein
MMGATKIMVIRHAQKPGTYGGHAYDGVDAAGATCGADGAQSLATIGWERAGALTTLFAPPWGPKLPLLATPDYIYAADPAARDPGAVTPSQRPYETVRAVAALLGVKIDCRHKKGEYAKVVADALGREGAVLICWRQEEIAPIARCILRETSTMAPLGVPASWPTGPNGPRYDLIWVFDRPSGSGPMTAFTQFAQMLLPGDAAAPVSSEA